MNNSNRNINSIQPIPAFQQSENSALKYTINYIALLQAATISSSTFSATPSLTISSSNTTTTTTATISGSPGRYKIVNKIVTSTGETIERIIPLHIQRNVAPVVGDYQC